VGKILFFLFVAVAVGWSVYIARSQGLMKTEADRTLILTAEGRVTDMDLAAGEVDIFYSDRVPDCYPVFGKTKVSNPDLLKAIKKGDPVSFEFKAVRLPVKAREFVPLRVKEITSIQLVAGQTGTDWKTFHCPG
jgi:hypothetical protein